MRFNLRTLFMVPVVLAATAFATSAQAEATLKVPFSFTVGNKVCPAGLYTVNREASSNLVTLKSKDAARSFTWIIGPGDTAPNASSVTLRFNETGNNHSLRTVQYGSMITSRLDKGKHTEHVHVETITGQ